MRYNPAAGEASRDISVRKLKGAADAKKASKGV
jgi:hypothetical protein